MLGRVVVERTVNRLQVSHSDLGTALGIVLAKTYVAERVRSRFMTRRDASWTHPSNRTMMSALPIVGPVMDVVVWLRSLGLERYEAAFRENAITEKVLPRLTAEDLKDLGVSIVGHRRVLLDAIADLRSGTKAEAAPSEGPSTTAAPAKDTSAERRQPASTMPLSISGEIGASGERRFLTVMFCDLVGSTNIAAKLDAEEWRDLVSAYLDAASAAVSEMGGYVAKKLGDGLMALFGYPLAQENDAERAARAALAIQRALAELNRKNARGGRPELVARIGLETGPAVVDATGEVYGDVANIAARVQALAEPGAVMVTARVQRQIAGLFVAEERGFH